jgi:hypothetical protein
MKFGLTMPPIGPYSDPRLPAGLGVRAALQSEPDRI